jgi:hypothetical protein
MNWYKKAQEIEYVKPKGPTDDLGNAELYFNVGHGEFNEKTGFEPIYYVWAIKNNRVEAAGPFASSDRIQNDPKMEDRVYRGEVYDSETTHAREWGYQNIDKMFRGRYEPETGNLTIIKTETFQYRDVPFSVLNMLYRKFKGIKKVLVF